MSRLSIVALSLFLSASCSIAKAQFRRSPSTSMRNSFQSDRSPFFGTRSTGLTTVGPSWRRSGSPSRSSTSLNNSRTSRYGSGRYQAYYPSSSFGFSIGVGSPYIGRTFAGRGYPNSGLRNYGYIDPYRFDGYGYDPYRYGSFRHQDILKDPNFIRQNPNTARGRDPRGTTTSVYQSFGVVNGSVYRDPRYASPPYAGPSHTSPPSAGPLRDGYRSGSMIMPESSSPRATNAANAPARLEQALAARSDGEVWLEYLAPGQVNGLIQTGDPSAIAELAANYDGVLSNPELRSIATISGFSATRELLHQLVDQSSLVAEPVLNAPDQVPATRTPERENEQEEEAETLTLPEPVLDPNA